MHRKPGNHKLVLLHPVLPVDEPANLHLFADKIVHVEINGGDRLHKTLVLDGDAVLLVQLLGQNGQILGILIMGKQDVQRIA
ncbi:hypothetical protein D3C81_2034240 [compost metagenome]